MFVFRYGFLVFYLDLDFGLDFDWFFSGFWLKDRRVWTMLGKGPERPGFGLGLRPYIIGYYFRSSSMDYARQGFRVTRIRLRT